MAHSFVDRCFEVRQFLQQNKEEKYLLAKELLAAEDDRRIELAIRYLQTELRMHQEVRTLWPYLLAFPTADEAGFLCEMYECGLKELGVDIQTRIDRLMNSLHVIEDRFMNERSPSPFWRSMRDRFLQTICEEAEFVLMDERVQGKRNFFG
jgi:hypothetical protein